MLRQFILLVISWLHQLIFAIDFANNEMYEITIFDITGKIVLEMKNASNNIEARTYYIFIENDGTYLTKKIVVN